MNGWWLDGRKSGAKCYPDPLPLSQWGTLRVMRLRVTVLQVGGGACQRSFSVWHLRTADWIIISLLHRLHTPCFCSGLLLERQRLLYCLYLVSERWCLSSEAGRLCLFHSATIKLNLPLSVRGEFKNPRVCVTEQKWYQAKHNLTDSLEHALSW